MLKQLSLRELYPLAIADSGGVGLAYDYFVKRQLLSRWLEQFKKRRTHALHILIAGLPDQHSGLDLLQIIEELGITALIVDERPPALEKLNRAVATAQRNNLLQDARYKGLIVNDMGVIWEAATDFDLVFSSNVVQRLDSATQIAYLKHLKTIGSDIAIFAPNQANAANQQNQAAAILPSALRKQFSDGSIQTGYLSAPPFATMFSLSKLIREDKISARLRNIMFYSLQLRALGEKYTPTTLRVRQSRLVYGLWRSV